MSLVYRFTSENGGGFARIFGARQGSGFRAQRYYARVPLTPHDVKKTAKAPPFSDLKRYKTKEVISR